MSCPYAALKVSALQETLKQKLQALSLSKPDLLAHYDMKREAIEKLNLSKCGRKARLVALLKELDGICS
jgi:hypothetical protein